MIGIYRKAILRLSIVTALAIVSLGLPRPIDQVQIGCGICNGVIICPPHGQCVTCFPKVCFITCKPFQICNNAPQPNPNPPGL